MSLLRICIIDEFDACFGFQNVESELRSEFFEGRKSQNVDENQKCDDEKSPKKWKQGDPRGILSS